MQTTTASVKAKDEEAKHNFSRTKEIPEALSDKKLDKESRREVFCPSIIQDIEVNGSSFNEEDIHITKEDPEVLSDTKPDMDNGEVEVLGKHS